MLKKSLMSVMLIAATMSPAFAGSLTDDSESAQLLEGVASTLAARGLDVAGVESWGNKYRVSLVDDNGRETTVIYDRDTLQPAGKVSVRRDAASSASDQTRGFTNAQPPVSLADD